jgi:hypothetical protein
MDPLDSATYSGRVQQVILFSGLAGVIGGLALVASRWTFESGSVGKRIALGVIPGIAGAAIVGVWQTDLIPDQMESSLLPLMLGVGSFAIGLLVLLELRAR